MRQCNKKQNNRTQMLNITDTESYTSSSKMEEQVTVNNIKKNYMG
jgi:hypothetical protein